LILVLIETFHLGRKRPSGFKKGVSSGSRDDEAISSSKCHKVFVLQSLGTLKLTVHHTERYYGQFYSRKEQEIQIILEYIDGGAISKVSLSNYISH